MQRNRYLSSNTIVYAQQSQMQASQFSPQERCIGHTRRIKKEKRKKQREEPSKRNNKNMHFDNAKTSSEHLDDETVSSDSRKSKYLQLLRQKQNNPFLYKILTKPAYLTIAEPNQLAGDLGHGTAIFKRPLVEGNYFLEIAFREKTICSKKLKNKPSISVGICQYEHNCNLPLGVAQSFAYKSSDGSLMYQGQKIKEGVSYEVGDVLTILVQLSPPFKHPNVSEINPGSTVSFLKNGVLMHRCAQLKQTLYCLAVGLYNYSQAQILAGPQSRFSLPPSSQPYKHYFQSLNQEIIYKDLAQLKIFQTKFNKEQYQ